MLKQLLPVLALAFSTQAHALVMTDDFNDPSLSQWNIVSGSWNTNGNGQLIGQWPISQAHATQANILVNGYDTNLDFEAEYQFTFQPGFVTNGTGFSLFVDNNNKYNVNIATLSNDSTNTFISVEVRISGQNYATILFDNDLGIDCSTSICSAGIQKIGNNFELSLNSQVIGSFTDTVFNGQLQGFGLRAYGTATYESFSFTNELNNNSAPSNVPVPPTALLVLGSIAAWRFSKH